MNRVKFVLVAAVTLAFGAAAKAALIGVAGYLPPTNPPNLPDNPNNLPRTQFTATNVPGALVFDAATHNLTLNVADGVATAFSTRFVSGRPSRPHSMNSTPNSLSLSIRVLTNDGGTYVGNGAANDFVLMGAVDVNGDNAIGAGESGTLLTGSLLQFGYNNLPVTPGNPNGTPDSLDFRFAVTGGILAPLYAGKDIGVRQSMTTSTWPNGNVGGTEFQDSFQANASGDVIPIPCGGSIGDFVWNDLNRNGVQEPGEPGLNGVTVRLKNQSNAVIQTAITTNSSQGQPGFYNFSGLCLGSYSVEVDNASAQALGFVPTTAQVGNDRSIDSNATPSPVTITAGNYVTGNQTVDFGFKSACTGTIGDRVWHDLNRNGVQDPGEPGFQGWVVRLQDAGGAQIGAPILTGPNGSYQFVGLCTGAYHVDVAPPGGFDLTETNQGGDATVDSNVPQTDIITLATDFSSDSTIDFGYTGACEGTIGDYVWFDSNHDGRQDDNEPGIDGLNVTLNGPGGLQTATTGVNPNDSTRHGYYQFTGACTGTYTLDVQAPAGFVPSPDSIGGDRTIDNNGPANGGPASVTLASDVTIDQTIDFGFISCPGQIGDFVWQDSNLNGVQDLGEPGLPGVVVNLRRPFDNSILQSTTTGIDGKYGFAGLCPAQYNVEVVPPAGATASPAGMGSAALDSNVNPSMVTLTLGNPADLTVGFGFLSNGAIGDRVWNDINGDGVQNGGEGGLAGWTLSIMGPNYSDTQTTGADGSYAFHNLPAGAYTVCVIENASYVPTFDFDGLGTPLCATRTITAVDVNLADVDFGFRQPASMGNLVWSDINGNGVPDSGEPGLASWRVNITGPGGYSNSRMTSATGRYTFDSLTPGTYNVCVVPSFGYSETFDLDGVATLNCASRTVVAGGAAMNVNFGYRQTVVPTGSIGGFVWNDLNNNGIQEFGEPGLPGAPLTIAGSNLPTGYAVTQTADANGDYQFTGLPPGTYTITLPLVLGYHSSPTGQGNASTTCPFGGNVGAQYCDSNGLPGGATSGLVSSTVTLAAAGNSAQSIDFGLYSDVVGANSGTGVIGNFVWFDENRNGIQDATEPGLPGITLKISNTAGAGVGFTATTVTDTDGKYLFTNLLPGTYEVSVVSSAYVPTVTGKGTAATTCAGGTGAAMCDSNTSPATIVLADRGVDLTADFGLVPPPDNAQRVDQICNGSMTSVRVTGNLKVLKGANCTLTSVTVQGDIQADEAGAVVLWGVSVGRNVDIEKSKSVLIFGSWVKNDIHVHETNSIPPVSSGFARNVICNTLIGHDLHLDHNKAPFGIGDDFGCGNPGTVSVGHDAVINETVTTGTTAASTGTGPSVTLNSLLVGNNLGCDKNAPAVATSGGISIGHDNKCKQLTQIALPAISVSAWPPPDAGQWNQTDVAVTFVCSAPQAGVASCTLPTTVTTEGANQIITGKVVDKAGQVATASVTINLDKPSAP